MDELLNAVEKEKNNRFQKLWTKLDKGSKLNRLKLFISGQSEINELNEGVEYSDETYYILSIKNLKYNKEKKTYSLDLPKKTIKPTTKSKSNIDRHFSRSKDNKK